MIPEEVAFICGEEEFVGMDVSSAYDENMEEVDRWRRLWMDHVRMLE